MALALAFGGAAQAALLEVAPAPVSRAMQPAPGGIALSHFSVIHGAPVVAPSTTPSELPEPAVFAMMLLGLILIRYRASRHSDEKFE